MRALGRCEAQVAAVTYDDLETAFAFVSSAPPMENSAYLCLDTGVIYFTSAFNPIDEDLPDDLETSDRYIAIPHKNDHDLGRPLALRFVARELPEQAGRVTGFFRHKGAYARFKDLLESEGLLETWYKFEAEASETALREWCAENGIEIVQQNDGASA
jgi:hypothetical protein